MTNIVYDVFTYPNGATYNAKIYAIDYDPTLGFLYAACGSDQNVAFPTNPAHFKVWSISGGGVPTLLQTIAYVPSSADSGQQGFDRPLAILARNGKLYVGFIGGLRSYSVNSITGALTLDVEENQIIGGQAAPPGGYTNPVLMNRTSTGYLAGGLGPGPGAGNPWAVYPVVLGSDQGTVINPSIGSIGWSFVSKLNDTVMYACSNDGTNLYTLNIDDSGNVTIVNTVATGLSSPGGTAGPKVGAVVWQDNVYCGDSFGTLSCYFPITNNTTGALGSRVNSTVNITGNYEYYQDAISFVDCTIKNYLVINGTVFFRVDPTGSNRYLFSAVVPNVVGLTEFAANNAIYTAGYAPGVINSQNSTSVPDGQIISQNPFAGTALTPGSAVNYTLSLGPPPSIIPDLTNEPIIAAELLLVQDGFTVGTITFVQDSAINTGNVAAQDPIGGTSAPPGTAVNLTISVTSVPFDPDQTVISQYSNSPTLMQLVENMSTYLNPRTNLLEFYFAVWNIATAEGFGLDDWGRIVGVSRVIPIPGTSGSFGFANSDSPPDWQNFGNINNSRAGGPFFGGGTSTGSYTLNDGSFRTLILTKALANICATTAPALNQLITNLFPGRGTCYVQDLGSMKMRYVFEFSLTPVEYAILAYSGVLPHPAGVGVAILVVPSGGSGGIFGFFIPGANPQPYQPFNVGVFS
jgi:hypothetical protein